MGYEVWDILGEGNCGYLAVLLGLFNLGKVIIKENEGLLRMIKLRKDTQQFTRTAKIRKL